MNKTCLTKNITTANKVLPKAGLNGFDGTFVQGSIFVLRLNFSTKNSPPSAIPFPLAAISEQPYRTYT